MKSTSLHQTTKLLLTALAGVAMFISPVVSHSAEEHVARLGQDDLVMLALADTHSYMFDAAESNTRRQSAVMEARWQTLQQTISPEKLIKLGVAFEKDFPDSKYSAAEKDLLAGAQKVSQALREARLSSGALEETSGDVAYRDALTKAVRGDMDAAYRVAMMYDQGTNGLPRDMRRAEQWLRVSAELGNGHASWQVSQIYNRGGLLADAAKYETRAIEAGYSVPARLPTRARNY